MRISRLIASLKKKLPRAISKWNRNLVNQFPRWGLWLSQWSFQAYFQCFFFFSKRKLTVLKLKQIKGRDNSKLKLTVIKLKLTVIKLKLTVLKLKQIKGRDNSKLKQRKRRETQLKGRVNSNLKQIKGRYNLDNSELRWRKWKINHGLKDIATFSDETRHLNTQPSPLNLD